MKREIAMIAFVLLGMGMTASAQFGKKINLGKALQAGKDVVSAVTLSDADIANMSKEYMAWMDTHNPLTKPALLPNVVHNTHRTGIMCTGRIGKVRFQTEYTDRPCSRFETVFKRRHIHAVNFQRGTVFFQAQEIKTVILTRISGG